jgi:hypothetical protein
MVRLVILGVMAAMAGLCWLSWQHLGGWTFLAIPVVLWIAAKLVGGWLVKQLFMLPFKAKGAALRGATATVHSVQPCERPPARGDEDAADEEARKDWKWYRAEVTVTQVQAQGPFRMWEPGSLEICAPGYDPAKDGSEKHAEVKLTEIEQEGKFGPDEGMKFMGPHKLRITFRVRPATNPLVFHYYFHKFGQVRLP